MTNLKNDNDSNSDEKILHGDNNTFDIIKNLLTCKGDLKRISVVLISSILYEMLKTRSIV